MVETAKNAKKEKLPNIKYQEDDFVVEKQFEDNRGLYNKKVNRPQYEGHVGKCNHRVCKELDCSMDHLTYCYEVLNGRIIDGIQISDMIDRYGFLGAMNINRAQLALMNGKSKQSLKTTYVKLKRILNDRKPLEKFMKYQKEYEDLLLKNRRDSVVDGE